MLNKVMLIGNLGADPEVRYMPSGGAVTNISLATSRRWKDKQTGQQREETEWHRVAFFNRLAEIAGEYLKKGSKVYVEGRIKTTKYQKDGQDRYSTDIVADQMTMLDSRTGGTDDFNQQGQGGYTAPQANQNFQQQQPPVQQFNQATPQQPPVQQFNQAVQQPPAQQQAAQQFTPPPVQQPFNQPQQTAPVQQPINQGQQQPPVQQPPAQSFNQQPPVQQPPVQNPASAPVNDDFDDDIPF